MLTQKLAAMRHHRRSEFGAEGGFTLIELMVTLTLLGMLVMLGFPALSTWIRNTQIRTVAEALQNGVRLAQTESVRRNRQVVMTFTNVANPTLNPTPAVNGKSWAAQAVASPYINDGATAAEFIRSGAFADIASAVTIDTGGAKAICFNASGRVMGPTGSAATADCVVATTGALTFQITQPAPADRRLNVTVAPGGQVRMCDPNRPALSVNSPDGC